MSRNRTQQRLRWVKWGLFVLLGAIVIFGWGYRVADVPDQNTTPAPSPAPPSATAAPTPQPDVTDEPPKARAAVTAGQTCLSLFPSLQFSPEAFVRKQVRKLALPEASAELTSELVQSGPVIATQLMGYSTVSEAADKAGYSELPTMYRIERLDGDEAVISYFVESQWKDPNNRRYQYAGITVVTLKLVSGSWLLRSTVANPDDMTPELEEGLSYEQTVARYQPLLEGFRNVYDVS